MEGGTLSEWLHEVLEAHVEELGVTGVGKNSRGLKSDKQDASGLAEQLKIGVIEARVYMRSATGSSGWASCRRRRGRSLEETPRFTQLGDSHLYVPDVIKRS